MMDVKGFWRAVLQQDADAMRTYLHPQAQIIWPGTNELFTAEEFVRANCAYPNDWDGEVELVQEMGEGVVTVTRVRAVDVPLSFHAISFMAFREDKIIRIEEYWCDDGEAPQWRKNLHIGRPIDAYGDLRK